MGWIHGDGEARRRRRPVPAPAPGAVEVPRPIEYAVIFIPIRCPGCGSKNVRTTHTNLPVRYHKCRDCDAPFKSIERGK